MPIQKATNEKELEKRFDFFMRRFTSQQFKRSASADGPAAMGFTLSPRDGHKMPSDAENVLWLSDVEKL